MSMGKQSGREASLTFPFVVFAALLIVSSGHNDRLIPELHEEPLAGGMGQPKPVCLKQTGTGLGGGGGGGVLWAGVA